MCQQSPDNMASRAEERGSHPSPKPHQIPVHRTGLFLAFRLNKDCPEPAPCLAYSRHSENVCQHEQTPSAPHPDSTDMRVSQGPQPSSWQRPGSPPHHQPDARLHSHDHPASGLPSVFLASSSLGPHEQICYSSPTYPGSSHLNMDLFSSLASAAEGKLSEVVKRLGQPWVRASMLPLFNSVTVGR